MIIDGNSLSENQQIETDLCIIGAGVAGLAIANTLKGSRKIVMLEGGGSEPDAATQDLYKEATGGCDYQIPTLTRQRQLSGTATIWNTRVEGQLGAKYIPLDPLDFEKRDWVPNSGWDVGYQELLPFIAKAHQLVGAGPVEYGSESWETPEASAWKLGDGKIRSAVYQLASGKPFLSTIPDLIKTDQNVTIYTKSNVTQIVPMQGSDAISHVEVATLAGKKFIVKARQFILATGGLENPRLMLASAKFWPAGIGNQNDNVGRYLQDHPYRSTWASLKLNDEKLIHNSRYYDLHNVRGTWILGRFAVKPEVQVQERIMNCSMVLVPRLRYYRSAGVESMRQIRFMMRGQKSKAGLLGQSLKLLFTFPHLFKYRSLENRCPNPDLHHWSERDTMAYATFEPEIYFEQVPDRDNRIVLSDEKDALGLPRNIYKWRWTEIDENSSRRNEQIFINEFARLGIGTLKRMPANERITYSGHHHEGTTRIHKDPKLGVVDTDCRVHGVSNLFVAGCSVFPAGGFANPTLMLLTLALLAEKLR